MGLKTHFKINSESKVGVPLRYVETSSFIWILLSLQGPLNVNHPIANVENKLISHSHIVTLLCPLIFLSSLCTFLGPFPLKYIHIHYYCNVKINLTVSHWSG